MALDAVAGRKKGVEALDERRVVAEESRDAVNDSGRVDAARCMGQEAVRMSGKSAAHFCVLKSFMILLGRKRERG